MSAVTTLERWLGALLHEIAARNASTPAVGPLAQAADLALPTQPTVDLAARNGAASLLWSALSLAGRVEALAPDVRAALKSKRDREAALGLESEAAAQRLVDALVAAGIRVIALKGLALRSALYAPLGLTRAPGDIDIMVAEESLETARQILLRQGYLPPRDRSAENYATHQHIEPYRLPHSPSVLVDVHWTPLHPRSPFKVDIQQWWRSAVPLPDGPQGLLRLGDLDMALQYALQIDFADAYAGKGRGLFDWAAWVLHRKLELPALHERGRAGGATVAVPRMAAIADRTFGTSLAHLLTEKATPTGLVGTAWKRAVDASLWLPLREGRIPLWYVHYCSRALGRAPTVAAAVAALLRPVVQNPRLGGREFHAYPKDGA